MNKLIIATLIGMILGVCGFAYFNEINLPESKLGMGSETFVRYYKVTLDGHDYILTRSSAEPYNYSICPAAK